MLMENRMQKHLTVVAALQVGFSIFGIIAGFLLYAILMSVTGFVEEEEGVYIMTLIAKYGMLFLLIISIPGLIGGIGLFLKQTWARYLVLVISVFDLLNIPIGTAIAVYSIWVLVQDDTVSLFNPRNETAFP
jgi:hypothetical protein